MAEPLERVARQLASPLGDVEAETLARWAVDTARRNQQRLSESRAGDGTTLAPNAPKYARRKSQRGLDGRPGVATGELLKSVAGPGSVTVLNAHEAEVTPGPFTLKGQVLIAGARKRKQPPRDFMGHDEAVIEAAAEDMLERTALALGLA